MNHYELTRSPKLESSHNRKSKKSIKGTEFFELSNKKKKGSTSISKDRRSPYNSLDDGQKQVCLGKRKNRSKMSECVETEHMMNEGSKKGKSIQNEEEPTYEQNIDQAEQSFQTAKSDYMEQSTLGQALMKIGIQIGVHTGTMLNCYIKRRNDINQVSAKGGSISTGIKSEEEKNSDKSKKSRVSIISDNSALSKKRNAKIASKFVQKKESIQKNCRVYANHDS